MNILIVMEDVASHHLAELMPPEWNIRCRQVYENPHRAHP